MPRPFKKMTWYLDHLQCRAICLWLIATIVLDPSAALVIFQFVAQGTSATVEASDDLNDDVHTKGPQFRHH
jgi:hypothetical protein